MSIGSGCKILVSTHVSRLNPGPFVVSNKTAVGFSETRIWPFHEKLLCFDLVYLKEDTGDSTPPSQFVIRSEKYPVFIILHSDRTTWFRPFWSFPRPEMTVLIFYHHQAL